MILRLLNWQGMAGLAATLGLAILLLVQKAETRHWKTQSASFEQLYHQDQAAFATTVANYRAAADQARAADQANMARVTADESRINERIANEYETRLAAARAYAERLRASAEAAADPGTGRSAPLSLVSAASRGPAKTPGEDQLPSRDALTATEQAIQLDELIKWVRAQVGVDSNPKAVANRQGH